MGVKELWIIDEKNRFTGELISESEKHNIRIRTLDETQSPFKFGSSLISVLNPPADADLYRNNLNNKSMVLKIKDDECNSNLKSTQEKFIVCLIFC